MTTDRRDFLKSSAAAAIAAAGARVALPGALILPPPSLPSPAARGDAVVEDIALEALNAARDAGASYADVRIGRYRRQFVATRERQVTAVNDTESYGIGVRALVQGSAASSSSTPSVDI